MRNLDPPPVTLSLPLSEHKQAGTELWRSWESSAKACVAFRRDFRRWALKNQEARCAFCGLRVGRSSRRTDTLDHFIPKGPTGGYARWTYEPLNLLVACHECNSKIKHDTVELVLPAATDYRGCTFKMFHPYLHRPASEHFSGGYHPGRRPQHVRPISDLGERSVELFELRDPGLMRTWYGEYLEDRRAARIAALSKVTRALFVRARDEVN